MPTTRVTPKLVHHDMPNYQAYSHWCQGCNHAHTYYVQGGHHNWTFDGNIESPTFTPSMRMFRKRTGEDTELTICHYFLTNGEIQFLSDCLHKFAGQTLPLEPIPADYGFGDN